MFKPLHILQVGSMALLLAGCGSTPTDAVPLVEKHPATSSSSTSVPSGRQEDVLSAALAQADPAPIKAGKSIVSQADFKQSNGALTPDIYAYAQEVARVRNVPLAQVEEILKSASFNATVARLMTPSKTPIRRSWITYRNRFVEPVRIKAGVEFWTQNQEFLDKTARDYGVPASIIAAIIGVETLYGRDTGSFRVLDALATLGFRYPDSSRPERSQLFRDQLADLIELDHHKKLNALEVQGSFAGAMGLPQFMPGSLMRYAVDGDKDGRIDLLGSRADAIASVASFLRLHGWVPGLPVFAPVNLPADASKLVAGGLNPTLDWSSLRDHGASLKVHTQALENRSGPSPASWQNHKLGVVDLLDEPRNLAEYRTATPNFFAITHYNRSYFYAASVTDLAQELANRMGYDSPNQ